MRIPGSIFQPMSGHQIDMTALNIVRQVQPGVLAKKTAFDIERFSEMELMDMTMMSIDYRDLPDGVHGYTDVGQNSVVINTLLVDDPFSDIRFLRSTLAHETGHCILHVPILRALKSSKIFTQSKIDDGVSLFRKQETKIYCNPEWQAYRFAAGLLVPRASLLYHLERGETVMKVADIFEVTEKFMQFRMRGLKLL